MANGFTAPWRADEIDLLIELRESEMTFAEIAGRLGRTLASVGNKANRIQRSAAPRRVKASRVPLTPALSHEGRGGRAAAEQSEWGVA